MWEDQEVDGKTGFKTSEQQIWLIASSPRVDEEKKA
jgi:hypothetical protein